MLFIRRTSDRSVHSGQIAFPGGKYDPIAGDVDTCDTAIRETFEETQVVVDKKNILASLSPLYVPPSNFLIYPYVCLLEKEPCVIPAPQEVADFFSVPVRFLLNTNNVKQSEFDTIYGKVTAPCYQVNQQTKIWGATAIILSEFLCLERKRLA